MTAKLFINVSTRDQFQSTLYFHIKSVEQRTINTVIGTLAVDGWATFGTAKRGLGGLLLAVPNVTAHPSHQRPVPYSMWHYNRLCTLKGKLDGEVQVRPCIGFAVLT